MKQAARKLNASQHGNDVVTGLLNRYCKNGHIDGLLDAIVCGQIGYRNVWLRHKGTYECLVSGAEVRPSAPNTVTDIEKLPSVFRRVPSDYVRVAVNDEQQEMTITLYV